MCCKHTCRMVMKAEIALFLLLLFIYWRRSWLQTQSDLFPKAQIAKSLLRTILIAYTMIESMGKIHTETALILHYNEKNNSHFCFDSNILVILTPEDMILSPLARVSYPPWAMIRHEEDIGRRDCMTAGHIKLFHQSSDTNQVSQPLLLLTNQATSKRACIPRRVRWQRIQDQSEWVVGSLAKWLSAPSWSTRTQLVKHEWSHPWLLSSMLYPCYWNKNTPFTELLCVASLELIRWENRIRIYVSLGELFFPIVYAKYVCLLMTINKIRSSALQLIKPRVYHEWKWKWKSKSNGQEQFGSMTWPS